VPLTIKNSCFLMTRSGSHIGSAKVQCIISPPILPETLAGDTESTMIQRIRDTIAANLEK
jgi:hypothetical protein